MPVQHFEGEGWVPSEALGSQYGRNAAANAGAIGFPQGINVWVDLEGVSAHTPAANVIAYCNAWSDEVEGAGFVPGVYVGPGAGVSSDDLFFRLKTKHYWRAGAASSPTSRTAASKCSRACRTRWTVSVSRSILMWPRTTNWRSVISISALRRAVANLALREAACRPAGRARNSGSAKREERQ